MNELSESFNEYFEIVCADTPELLNEAYKIRFHSYCLEQKVPDFEAEKYPDGLETDDYDEHSVHCLLRNRNLDKYIGTVRLVLNNPNDPTALFPVEQYARSLFDQNKINPDLLPRIHTAEISRLCILNDYRIRKGENNSANSNIEKFITKDSDRRTFPHPILGLMVAIMRMTVRHNITHWYAGMENDLNKRLSMLGLGLTPIGPLLEYHGKRKPYLGIVNDVMNSIYGRNRDIWGLLTEEGQLWPAPGEDQANNISNIL
jgi:N-acyl amino acid synthase of PEP-CTERM/exosortase system